MNKWHGISVLLLLLAGDLGILRYSEACNTVSSIQCVNSTHYLWCVEDVDGTLVVIGSAQACPSNLVCDETQIDGCVVSGTVITTESTFDSTTNPAPITTVGTEITTDVSATTTTEESSVVSDAEFTCTYEGLYKAHDCTRFHVCYKIIWFIRHYFARCSEGLYWSSDQNRCVLQSLSDCL